VIAEIALPSVPTGTPITYLVSGKQYIVLGTVEGRLIALSLPSDLADGKMTAPTKK
jgi:hypothetical protein